MLLYPEVGLCNNEVPQGLREKYDENAHKYWDSFYRRNADKFYKDRHYFDREFPELLNGKFVLLEVGCGAGNSVFPLLELNPEIQVFACDFSPRAVQIVQSHPQYASGRAKAFVPRPLPPPPLQGRAKAFVADITQDDLTAHVPRGSVDFVTMVFVLSAITPDKMHRALANVAAVLRPGSGRVLFRDYGRGDLAQDKHQSSGVKRLGENFFVRGDGTCCFYFSEPELQQLFAAQGFSCMDIKMHEKDVENHKRQITMHRRWVQAVFQLQASAPPPSPHVPLAIAQQQPLGEDCTPVAGSWLVGAAGRLASGLSAPGVPSGRAPRFPVPPCTSAPPGVPSGRAQLPLSLESADELAQALLQPGRPPLSASQMEEELDRDFFDTITRDTQEVVEEELAAATSHIAAIRLAEPLEAAAAAAAMHGHPRQHPPPPGTQQQQAAAAWLPPGQPPAASPSFPAEEVAVAPGLSFQCLVPLELRGAMELELALARLLVLCPQLLAQRSVIELNAGTSGVAAMTAVRRAQRVVSTHSSLPHLHLLARNLHLNSPRLVVERLRTCQLAWRSPSQVQQALRQAPEPPGCFDLVLAAGLVEQALGQEASRSGLGEALGTAWLLVQLQRQSGRMPSVRQTRPEPLQLADAAPAAAVAGALAVLVERQGVLAAAEQSLGLSHAIAAAGWTVQSCQQLPQLSQWSSACLGQFEAVFLAPMETKQ